MASKKFLLAVICSVFLTSLNGQSTIPLYDGIAPNSKRLSSDTAALSKLAKESGYNETPELTLYLPKDGRANAKAVIICPGGGYAGLSMNHEGHDMARRFLEKGIAAFVLKYRLPNAAFLDNKDVVPLQDAQRAIQLVRENAAKWNINPAKIGIMGSSAGGHLASTAGTHFQKAQIPNPKQTSLRPDFLILVYPVISMADSLTHGGSRLRLIGDLNSGTIDRGKIAEFSNELQVTAQTPPTFVTHAMNDEVVKIDNAILFVAALQKNKVAVETFFYALGGHGFGMYPLNSGQAEWMDNCLSWVKKL